MVLNVADAPAGGVATAWVHGKTAHAHGLPGHTPSCSRAGNDFKLAAAHPNHLARRESRRWAHSYAVDSQ